MTFSLSDYFCNGNASYCLPIIEADGVITKNTPKDFELFIKQNKDGEYNRIIFFNSYGGDLISGLSLAESIRKNEFSTHLTATCYSACAYAFLGGKSRKINADAKYGLHRFYAVKDVGDSETQQVTTLVSRFLDNMDVDRRLLDIASLTDKSKIKIIDRDLAIKLNIVNTVPTKHDWELKAKDDGSLYACSLSEEHYRKASGLLCLFYDNNKQLFNGKYFFTITQKSRTNKQMLDLFKSDEITITTGEDDITLQENKWKPEGKNTFSISLEIPVDVINKILQQKEFTLNALFPNFANDVEPKSIFTTNKLKGNVLALSK